ncbi:hypothetical protein VCV18_001391 [Metarhizium anisopliae]
MVQTGFGALGTQQQHGVATSGAAHVATKYIKRVMVLLYRQLRVEKSTINGPQGAEKGHLDI